MKLAFLLLAAVAVAACSDSGGNAMDMSIVDLASLCGHPGDKGNSLGVGQYCQVLADCTGKASICSTLGSNNTFFCTFVCHQASDAGPATDCGENATCFCGSQGSSSGCACYPTSCQ